MGVEQHLLDEEHEEVPDDHERVRQRVVAVVDLGARLDDVREDVRQARGEEDAAAERVQDAHHRVGGLDALHDEERQHAPDQGLEEDAREEAHLEPEVVLAVVVILVLLLVLELARVVEDALQHGGARLLELVLGQNVGRAVILEDVLDREDLLLLIPVIVVVVVAVVVVRVSRVRVGGGFLAAEAVVDGLEHLVELLRVQRVALVLVVRLHDVLQRVFLVVVALGQDRRDRKREEREQEERRARGEEARAEAGARAGFSPGSGNG